MAWFNFEKNLEHQTQAVEGAVWVFEWLEIINPNQIEKNYVNPVLDFKKWTSYVNNIWTTQEKNNITRNVKWQSNIIDIMMETGTGKTYTYTKTIFELNKLYGINKFVVVVPTLSIKAGTINFLNSESSRNHFKEQYWKTLNLHIVESQKSSKSKKSYLPPAVNSFVNAGTFDKNQIQVMIINAWMINSDTMQKKFDTSLFDKYSVPFDAIAATNPFLIIDEPHKFSQGNKTWENILKMNPQFILRYWATFDEDKNWNKYENLVYTLTWVDSFNRNLVKWVIGHITEFDSWKNAIVKLISTDWKESSFELIESKLDKNNKSINTSKNFKLSKKDSLEKVHQEMSDLTIENLNKTTVVLSNWLELKKWDKLNPYSYSETLWENMIQKTIKNHFKLEKEFLTREVKIKPLTLFFIDNIDEYRNEDWYIKQTVEKYIESEIKELLKSENDEFYKWYLEKTLKDISKSHGWYFSKDNSEKDEAIENEVNEILHDKETMLSLDNPRRFIFSKWTLREGWDNPNVFQICKLRSSWSETSKLQEVWRWLRLPVNEYWNRVKEEQFFLDYFVDFTESDFIDKLKDEINEKSWWFSKDQVIEVLSDEMITKIVEIYKIEENDLLEKLDEDNVIKRNNEFKEWWFEYIKKNYPLIFWWVDSSKIRKETDRKKKVSVRTEKYPVLKDLWEKLNQKVILEYKFNKEEEFKTLLSSFLKLYEKTFNSNEVNERVLELWIVNNEAIVRESIKTWKSKIQISTMIYTDFLKTLSFDLNVNIKTLHDAILDSKIDINNYLNNSTIRSIKQRFNIYLLHNSIDKFSIEYHKVWNTIHPTKLTDSNWDICKSVISWDIWVHHSDEKVADNYIFEELFYDSELEKENISKNITEVVVFSKIPKNSIKIPVAWWKTYSPDFAYVLNYEWWEEKLYFVVETKNTTEESLREEEKQKIKHAEMFFNNWIKIRFESQFQDEKISDLIKKIIEN